MPFLLRCCASLAMAWALPASTIKFTGLPQDYENGTYNGFVSGYLDGVFFNDLICDDFLDDTRIPSGPFAFNAGALSPAASATWTRPASPP